MQGRFNATKKCTFCRYWCKTTSFIKIVDLNYVFSTDIFEKSEKRRKTFLSPLEKMGDLVYNIKCNDGRICTKLPLKRIRGWCER